MNIETIKKGIAALEDAGYKAGEYNPHNVRAWAIGNEFGLLGVVVAEHEAEALDEAVDHGIMDSEMMDPKAQAEYEAEDWYDSFTYAGNASEAIWTEYLTITAIDTGAIYHETVS